MVTANDLQEVTQYFNNLIKAQLGTRIECLAFVGSYAMNAVSLDRPDINYLLIWKDRSTAEDYLTLGKILHETVVHFEKLQLNFEFRPFKFGCPRKSNKPEVFINISLFNLSDKASNFFIPAFVLEGFQSSQKVIFGEDVLGKIKFEVTKKTIFQATPQKLSSHKVHIDRLPLIYSIKENTGAFFNETLDHGKNLAYFGVELLMSEEEIVNKDYLPIIADKERLVDFYSERATGAASNAVKTILECRKNYSEWKGDSKRAEDLYKASFLLHGFLTQQYLKQAEATNKL